MINLKLESKLSTGEPTCGPIDRHKIQIALSSVSSKVCLEFTVKFNLVLNFCHGTLWYLHQYKPNFVDRSSSKAVWFKDWLGIILFNERVPRNTQRRKIWGLQSLESNEIVRITSKIMKSDNSWSKRVWRKLVSPTRDSSGGRGGNPQFLGCSSMKWIWR